MKFPDPTPQKHFEFTKHQRLELLSAWVKGSDKNKAIEFLTKIESTIAYWMFMSKRDRPSNKEKSEQLMKIQKHTEQLINTLNNTHPDTIEWLGIQADCFVNNEKNEEFTSIKKKFTSNSQKASLLKDYHPLFDEMLNLINASASELINVREDINLKSKNRWEKNLVLMLALDYESVFKKKPGYSKSETSTPFTSFIKELSKILYIELGDITIRSGLDY